MEWRKVNECPMPDMTEDTIAKLADTALKKVADLFKFRNNECFISTHCFNKDEIEATT